MKNRVTIIALVAIFVLLFTGVVNAVAGPMPGAIFTTLKDGTRVNANIYPAKEDVYLDGGPGPHAPVNAASLNDGWYYFQVTDPSGKVLLSQDAVKNRKFRVAGGRIVEVFNHLTGTDVDYGALTVQLMPYKNTPNNGGVYKVWATPVEKFVGNIDKVDNPSYFHGFIPAWSKTDNYKVKGKMIPPTIKVRKFLDKNANGVWDTGEVELFDDFTASYVDPLGTSFEPQLMPFTVDIALPDGTWVFTEQMKTDWFQTAAYVDRVKKPNTLSASVLVAGTSGETHEVIFGNCPKGDAKAFKYIDHNLNAQYDTGEAAKKDVTFKLEGTDVFGAHVGPLSAITDSNGYAYWPKLLPGTYSITEVVPTGFFNTTAISQTVTVVGGEEACASFGNARYIKVAGAKFYDVNTNGIWDSTENPLPGVKVVLTGTDYLGNLVGPDVQFTGLDGTYTWENLLPGDYTVSEVMPLDLNWFNVTPLSGTGTVEEGDEMTVYFGNAYKCYVAFRTKGFWHNQNGLAVLAAHPEWIAYVNGLDPYKDNPFDGLDPQGNPVPAAKNVAGETIASAGTALAEVSNFLVASNSDYQQLEQQLLAFSFNVKWRGVGVIVTPDGPVLASGMIDSAVEAWNTGVDVVYWVGILDGYNNLEMTIEKPNGVPIVCPNPGPIDY